MKFNKVLNERFLFSKNKKQEMSTEMKVQKILDKKCDPNNYKTRSEFIRDAKEVIFNSFEFETIDGLEETEIIDFIKDYVDKVYKK